MMTADYENELDDLEPDEYEEDETALMEMEDEETPGRWQALMAIATDHPRLSCGTGSLAISLIIDLTVRFDPFVSILGLVATAVIGFKGEDLLQTFVPSADPEQANQVVTQMFDYPMYKDQSPKAKLLRLFRQGPDELYELAEPDEYEEEQRPARQVRQLPPLQRREVKKLPPPNNGGGAGQGLTYERITDLFLSGNIDDTRFLALIDCLDNPTKSATRSGRNAQPKAAPEEDVSLKNADATPAALPPGWKEEHLQVLPYLYRIEGNIDTCLKGMELSTHPRNREFAKEILKQQGLYKEK